jgi:hypothetical protein
MTKSRRFGVKGRASSQLAMSAALVVCGGGAGASDQFGVALQGQYGGTNNANSDDDLNASCNNTEYLICYVNP